MELMATWELFNVGVAFDDEFFQANRACVSWWLMAESSGHASNSTLKNHISHPQCEALKRVAESVFYVSRWFVYDLEVLREQFTGLVIQRGSPFNHFDDEKTTRVFQNHCNQNTIILTTDVWTAPHGLPVIAFEDFLIPHTGSALAKTLRNVFVNFNLENKIMSIILDNASNDTAAIGKLKLKYEPPMEEFLIELISTDLKFLDDGYATKAKKWFIDSLEGLYNIYYTKYGNPITTTESSSGASSSRTSGGNQMTQFLEGKGNNVSHSIPHGHGYTKCPSYFGSFRIRIFNKWDGVVNSKNTTHSGVLRDVYVPKDHLDAQERKQDKSTLETPVDFEEEILDAEVQENKAISLSDKEIALDAASSECSMSGPGSRGEEGDYGYDMMNYHDDY
nr:hypothetical protein [Tanacetum cinerariifolium]